ncbi:50S ribosomal protein L25 [Paenibacillus hexagrammi]|uniref:Large ribosomal subunit protein bL25 n=1 Tax=Paenibacillus hexagrammi TaxID=2908839 RepID=A0ABY3SGG4_9BACL|nr:50S ribosomal protein L25 [Paenibacillus sp. YPD9-1]UJF33123.1 50S ribosomal protein L25 [Paenibacillus sp. YPD9-1]
MALTLNAESRQEATKSEIKQLRAQGKVPGVVYGKKVGSTVVAIDQKELLALMRTNQHAIIEMQLPDGGKQPVMISEVQRDKINRNLLLHVDFHQINMDEPVKTVVPIEIVGEAEGAKEGGIVQIQLHELEIRCLPQHIPSSVKVDISHLGLGENILVSEITVAGEIEIKSDSNELIVTLLAPQKETAAVEDPAESQDTKASQSETVAEEAKEEQTV